MNKELAANSTAITWAPMAVCGRWRARCGERTRKRHSAGWRELAGTLGWPVDGSVADGRRQAGSGTACSRARARLNCSSQGQRRGRCRVNRRAERVSRPAMAKNRRRRVLVLTICSPRKSRASSGRGYAPSSASQAALAAKRPEGRWFTDAVLEGVSTFSTGVAAMISLQFQGLSVPVA